MSLLSMMTQISSEIISDRREATEEQLNQNERALASFLRKNGIGDFESEQTGLRERTEDLKASLNGTRASIAEAEAALAAVEDQLRQTPETIDLYVDDRAQQRVAQAELELRQLMAKYLPTSDPVKQKQTELNELRALQSANGGRASGGRRVGPNTTHQTLMENRNELVATPAYQNLLRERETLKTRLNSYNAKEQEALVDAQQAEDQAENVKVISFAQYANKGRNMRKWAWLGATAAWGFLLFFIAMIRVFLDPRLYAVPASARVVPMQQSTVSDAEPMYPPVQEPLYSPIPEAVPEFNPGQPLAPNPYETQPAAYSGAHTSGAPFQTGGYDPNNYVHYSSTGDVYGTQPAYDGTGALDISHNPYATGEVQAGALEDYANYVLDPNASPQS